MPQDSYTHFDDFLSRTGWSDAQRWAEVQDLCWNDEGAVGMQRRQDLYSPFFQRFGRNVQIDAGCRFSHPHRIILEDGVRINRDAIIEGSSAVHIGRNARIGQRFFLHSANHDVCPNNPLAFFERAYTHKPVWIGDNVLISANVSILPGVRIGHGCFVAEGATVTAKEYVDNSYLAGSPVRPFKVQIGKPAQKLQPAPSVALMVSASSRRKAAAELLLSTLGMPQIAVFSKGAPLPRSVRVAICLDEGISPPEGVDEFWQAAPGDREIREDEELKINIVDIGDVICPKRLAYDISFNGFGMEPTLANVTRGHLFRASNAYLKGTDEMRDEVRGAWALSLLAGLTSNKKEDPRWSQLMERVGPELIDAKVTARSWRSCDQHLKTIFKREIERLADGNELQNFFFKHPKKSGLASLRRKFIDQPWLLPAFIWFNLGQHEATCEAIVADIAPHLNTSPRLSCLGLSYRLLGNHAAAENILSTLLSPEWIAKDAALLRVHPDTKAIDRYPPLVAFLADQLIAKDDADILFGMKTPPVVLTWSGFEHAEQPTLKTSTSLALYDLETRRFSKSLFDNWMTLQELPEIETSHFYLSDWNYHRPCQALEAVWRDLIALALDQAGLPAVHIRPWPSGYNWALAIRYDVDRTVTSKAAVNIVRIQKEYLNAGCGSWYYLANTAHAGKTKRILKGWNQESAHHTHLSNEKAAQGLGATAHSAADSEYWRGKDTIKGLEAIGALYAEAMLSAFPLPRPGWFGDRQSKIWLTPLHFPLEGSTIEETTAYFDQRLESFREQIASGGLAIIGSHPDCNQDILDEVLAREDLDRAWAVPVAHAVERVKALYSAGNVTIQAPEEATGELHLVSRHTLCDVAVEICQPGSNGKWTEQTLQLQAGIGRPLITNPGGS